MKKLALALVLLIVLVAVSYLTATRSHSKLQQRYDEGYSKGNAESKTATKRADSLQTVFTESSNRYQESLKVVRAELSADNDSLKQVVTAKDSEIIALKQKAKSAKPTKTQAKKAPVQSTLNHAQILDYYKQRINDLPKDLSDYERKVALVELKEETAKKFSISVGELDKIRQQDSLKD